MCLRNSIINKFVKAIDIGIEHNETIGIKDCEIKKRLNKNITKLNNSYRIQGTEERSCFFGSKVIGGRT